MIDNDSKVFINGDGDKKLSLNDIMKEKLTKYPNEDVTFLGYLEYCGDFKFRSLSEINITEGGVEIGVTGYTFKDDFTRHTFKTIADAINHLNETEMKRAKSAINMNTKIVEELSLLGYNVSIKIGD